MVNVSAAEPLVYLCISTMRGAEIVEYPDSGKVGAGVADPTNPVGFRRIGMFRAGSGTLDYWESEPEAGLSLVQPHSPDGEAYTTWRGTNPLPEALQALAANVEKGATLQIR
jgi:hypothetical protein